MTLYATISAGRENVALMPDVPMLFPASSWHRQSGLRRAPRIPGHVQERAADSGGFVAMTKWGGAYPYTMDQYADWLETFGPSWAATMDYCCEPSIATDEDAICRRQERTTAAAWEAWDGYRGRSWCWVPTVQGWDVRDYIAHARQLAPLIEEMSAYYGHGSAFRVGIGTLCQRASARMIRTVAAAVAHELPGIPLHLWGIKLDALKGRCPLPEQVVSCDSSAWEGLFAKGIERFRASGMTQREYIYRIALPEYLAKVQDAQRGVKQTGLQI